MAGLIVLGVLVLLVLVVLGRSVRIIPQARAGIVERLGRYHRTLDAGLALVIPFVDREGRHPEWDCRLPDLYALPAALGLTPARAFDRSVRG